MIKPVPKLDKMSFVLSFFLFFPLCKQTLGESINYSCQRFETNTTRQFSHLIHHSASFKSPPPLFPSLRPTPSKLKVSFLLHFSYNCKDCNTVTFLSSLLNFDYKNHSHWTWRDNACASGIIRSQLLVALITNG